MKADAEIRMKECPSCSEDIPAVASVCKHCFQDFTDTTVSKRSGGPLFVLGAVAAMAVIGAMVLGYLTTIPVEERILVDQDTQSVVWTRQFRTGVTTERLAWSEITKLEYVVLPTGDFEVVAVTPANERHVIHAGKRPLKSEAEKYSQLMKKPLEEVDKTRGFHKMD
jgi:hypothetical protein